ncbi:MAG: T9SS type A sorting domain-containing protein, partial [Prevotellaceae bacterium]|nr:T9SS type A sorting domain-containing protein [Prevotellaceae bacterium]
YSAGVNLTDQLTPGASYTFALETVERGTLTSTPHVVAMSTAVGEAGYAPLRVYPNPATGGQLTIASEQGKAGDVAEVYSLLGVLVATHPVVGDLTTIDIAHLPPGTYIVKVGSRAAKVVKQ